MGKQTKKTEEVIVIRMTTSELDLITTSLHLVAALTAMMSTLEGSGIYTALAQKLKANPIEDAVQSNSGVINLVAYKRI